jgi:drug/metabolite transporter (DMT)-like permease
MIGNGVINAVGQYWWTRALSLAPPSAAGPFYYFMLVWSAALGFVFWGDMPTLALFAGSATVVGSGLFLLGMRQAGNLSLPTRIQGEIDEPGYPPSRDRA